MMKNVLSLDCCGFQQTVHLEWVNLLDIFYLNKMFLNQGKGYGFQAIEYILDYSKDEQLKKQKCFLFFVFNKISVHSKFEKTTTLFSLKVTF